MKKKNHKKEIDYTAMAAGLAVIAGFIFASTYYLNLLSNGLTSTEASNSTSNPTQDQSSSNYVLPPPKVKLAILNMAERAKTSKLFSAEVDYIQKVLAENPSLLNFSAQEKQMILQAIAKK